MSTRKISFASGEFYHVFNRGVDKRIIFSDNSDMDRFFRSLIEFNTVEPIGSLYENSRRDCGGPTATEAKLVQVVAYCLNPNHYHLILEQLVDGGISEFMKRIGGYTWYFNNKHGRNGALFQGKFKATHIDSNEYLLHVSAYVNLNERVHKLERGGPTATLVKSKSSWEEYVDEGVRGVCEKDIVLGQFGNTREYESFARSSLESILQKRDATAGLDAFLLE